MSIKKYLNEANERLYDLDLPSELRWKETLDMPKICLCCYNYEGNAYEGRCESYTVFSLLKQKGIIKNIPLKMDTSPFATCKFYDPL